jgi:integrase/recombinase XerD
MATDLVLLAELMPAVDNALKLVAPSSQRVYAHDVRVFATWLAEQDLTLQTLTRDHLIAYRAQLRARYAVATAQRMFTVARRVLDELVQRGQLSANPCSSIRGFTVANESPHTALTRAQAQALLAAVPRETAKGQRDYALLLLLLRTGLRRAECAALDCADLTTRNGHHVAVIRHGKGDKRHAVKLPVEVYRAIEAYRNAAGVLAGPLFVGFDKGDHPTCDRVSTKLIERVVKQYARLLEDVPQLSPHGLRASFVTLALEGGAKLQQVQYAAGHADPRTTERYQRRKENLDDNAVDYIHIR